MELYLFLSVSHITFDESESLPGYSNSVPLGADGSMHVSTSETLRQFSK